MCIEAATTGRPVFVPDTREPGAASRWPVFAAAVAEQTPIRSLCALPLMWGTTNLGVLDLYRLVPEGLSDAQRRDALSAADVAALLMLTLRTEPADPGPDLPDSWLEPMVASRVEVHQATGMVLAQLNLSADQALARLRAYAFVEGRLLIDVARDVVARRLTFSPADDTDDTADE